MNSWERMHMMVWGTDIGCQNDWPKVWHVTPQFLPPWWFNAGRPPRHTDKTGVTVAVLSKLNRPTVYQTQHVDQNLPKAIATLLVKFSQWFFPLVTEHYWTLVNPTNTTEARWFIGFFPINPWLSSRVSSGSGAWRPCARARPRGSSSSRTPKTCRWSTCWGARDTLRGRKRGSGGTMFEHVRTILPLLGKSRRFSSSQFFLVGILEGSQRNQSVRSLHLCFHVVSRVGTSASKGATCLVGCPASDRCWNRYISCSQNPSKWRAHQLRNSVGLRN